jgi:tRNA dimethylallyltransferase
VGKTRVSLALARRLGAEIISLDSMAVYRGMDIGTAKPSPQAQREVPHHLIDLVEPSDEFSVAQYVEHARHAVEQIRGRGGVPLFVGGTPLYLKVLLRGMFDGPGANWELRQQIEQEAATLPPGELHRRLQQLDPLAASAIHANDTRRIVRALEVIRSTGQPISHQQLEFEDGRAAIDCRVFVLRRDRDEQHQRIEQRVDDMLSEGLVDEVTRLTADGGSLSRTASQAVGYREVLDHLSGATDYATMVEQIRIRTRRFAKRQATWFRSLSECRFVDLRGTTDVEQVVQQIATAGNLSVEDHRL